MLTAGRRWRAVSGVAGAVLGLMAGVVGIAPARAAVTADPLDVNRFDHGSRSRLVDDFCSLELCTDDLDFPESFLDIVHRPGMGSADGNTPIISCPPNQGCSVDVSKDIWLVAVSPESDDVALGTDIAVSTVTITGPPGTVFPRGRLAYAMADGQHVDNDPAPDFLDFDGDAQHPVNVTTHTPNRVELHISLPYIGPDEDLYIWIADVTNPPAGTYTGFNFRVTSNRQDAFPGHWDHDVEFTHDDAVRRNSTLTAAQTVVTAGESTGLTATLRDRFGNPVPDRDVFIAPLTGSAGIDEDDPSTTTDDDGEVTFSYKDFVAETVRFRALAMDSLFVFPLDVWVDYVPAAPAPEYSSVVTADPSVPADGATSAEIVVRLSDRFQNPNQGDEILLLPQPVPGGPTGVFTDGVVSAKPGYGCTDPVHPVPGVACATVDGDGNAPHQAEARFLVRTSTAGPVRFTVSDLTKGALLEEFATVTFTAAAPSDARLDPATQTVVADGTSAATVTASLRDPAGNPVPGITVTLSVAPGTDAVVGVPTATTSGAGEAVFTVRDGTVEVVELTATYTGTVNGTPVSGTVAPATVDFVPGPPVASSAVTAVPTSRLADGEAASVVVVTLVDGGGRPAPDYAAALAGSAGHGSTITPQLVPTSASGCPTQVPAGTTDCEGRAAFAVVDSTIETVTYEASVPSEGLTLTQTVAVAFTPPPGIDTTTISASPATVLADGSSTSTISVGLRDADGEPLAGKDLCLTQRAGTLPGTPPCPDGASAPSTATAVAIPTSESGCPAPAPAGRTDCRGEARFAVAATAPAAVTYGIVDLTDFPDVPLGPTTSVTFTAVPTEAGSSSVTSDVAVALADGGASQEGVATVTVTLRDGAGTALAGNDVVLDDGAATGAAVTAVAVPPSVSGCGAATPAGTSDCNGQARFRVTDAAVEVVTLRATDVTSGTTLTQTSTVTFLPDEAAVSTVTASPTQVFADGGTTSAGIATVTVTLDPEVPLVGHQVVLLQPAGGGSRIVATEVSVATSGCAVQRPAGTSDCHGTVAFTVTDTSVGTVTYTAFDQTSGVRIDQVASVAFVDQPPVLTAIAPTTGPPSGGTEVTITGLRFATAPGQTTVTFGGVVATDVSCATRTSCTAVAPAGVAGAVPVVVTTASGPSGPATFTYVVPAPEVTGVSPASGPLAGGTVVTVTGTNLHGATAVHFGTASVPVESIDADGTQVTAIAPAATAGTVDVQVVTPGGTSATNGAARYSYVAPRPPDRCAGRTGLALLLCRLGL